jgi:dienelactone hydrolase
MNKFAIGAVALLGLFAFMPAQAAVKTKVADYQIGSATFEGFWAYDDAQKGKRPGVVIFSAWTGISDNEREHAERLAKLGYAVFVADTYGKGINPKPGKEAGMESGKYINNRPLYRERAEAGLTQLTKNPMVDGSRIAAIGYCFGGVGALELGRTGAPLKAIVVFHSDLSDPTPADDKNIKGHVLALQGGDDPLVPQAANDEFEKEMREANVDWQLVAYSHTVHAYTDKEAGSDNSKGAAYNAESEKRSWIAMKDFFAEYLR